MLNSLEFHQQILAASKNIPIIIQFYANWCGPCQSLKPTLEKIAKLNTAKWQLEQVDVEQFPSLSKYYRIKSIPTVLMLYQDKVIAQFVGAKPPYIIQNWLDNNLPNKGKRESISPIDSALNSGDISRAKAGIFDQLIRDYKEAPLINLLRSVDLIGKDNNLSRKILGKISTDDALFKLAKKVRDLLDVDDDVNDVRTPSSNPYHPKIVKAEERITLGNIDYAFLKELLFQAINQVRNDHGLADLGDHQILNAAALDHTRYQTQHNRLTHYQDHRDKKTVKDRIEYFGGMFKKLGENVQYQGFPLQRFQGQHKVLSSSYRDAVMEMTQNWVNSPGHFRNIVDPGFRYSGIAIDWNPENNALFATQVFGG